VHPAPTDAPGSTSENGCVASFNGMLRVEFLAGEVIDTLLETKVLIELGSISPYKTAA
jgi:hypothetical protein